MFNVEKTTNEAIQWIQDWFEKNGKGCNAVIGISGGKDSSIVAALCVKALGKERVIGVLMPNGEQADIDCSKQLVAHLGISYYVCNIKKAVDGVLESLKASGVEISRQTIINLPPRIRMSTLYALSQSMNGRVANTCNLSEDWVGYSTRYGDAAGDFSPLGKLTVQEVKAIGKYLDLPENLVDKVPSDGLTDRTDEDNLGFTYAMLDQYIRTGVCEDEEKKAKIDRLHVLNEFKLKPIPCYEYNPE
ncbi:MAG: NAD(+) synthase [Clostridia bacterium]|nr:NAD(+) synthase [Clostridia bacterium]